MKGFVLLKLEKVIVKLLILFLWYLKPILSTRLTAWWLNKNGATIEGAPNYISAKVWFDGGGYEKLRLGEGITISSNVRILTHDWALNTIRGEMEIKPENNDWLGVLGGVVIAKNSFIGTGVIILPGTNIGKACIVGAGTVVRGDIPDYSLVIGNPCQIVADTRNYFKKKVYK